MVSVDWIPDEDVARRLRFGLEDIEDEAKREQVHAYLKERFANGIDEKTLLNEVIAIRDLANDLGDTAFEDAERAHIVGHFADPRRTRKWRNRSKDGTYTVTEKEVELSQNTLAVRKQIVRHFYKWVYDTEQFPEPVRRLDISRDDTADIPTDELITSEDIEAMINAHHHARDRAILAVLYEGGLRAGELVNLDIRNVEFDEYGAVILLPTDKSGLKTGSRRVRLVDSVPYLKDWYESHPDKDDPDAPLFISISTRNRGERMSTNALYYFTTTAGEKAELGKTTNPHLFRHTSATEKARQGWTAAEMCAYFGWSPNSDMPARYNHLAGLDYEDMMLERLGVKEEDATDKRGLRPKVCPVCEADNPRTSTFCDECRHPLSPDAEEELQERRREEIREEVRKEMDQSEIAVEVLLERYGDELREKLVGSVLEELEANGVSL